MTFPWQNNNGISFGRQKKRIVYHMRYSWLVFMGLVKHNLPRISLRLCCVKKWSPKDSCHHCHTCRLVTGKSHPNVLWIEPEKDGHTIKIDQIRAVGEFVYQTSLQGEYRIVIINPASQMNANAANALLKMLEEPPSGAIIILIRICHHAYPPLF